MVITRHEAMPAWPLDYYFLCEWSMITSGYAVVFTHRILRPEQSNHQHFIDIDISRREGCVLYLLDDTCR